MSHPLAGSVAVVTGASSGIGRSYAQALDACGVSQVLLGRNAERLAAVADTMTSPVRTLVGDIADPALSREAVALAESEFGRLDILLPNAGLYLPDKGWTVPAERVHELVTTNVAGVMHAIHAALPGFLQRGAGDIVVTSSVSGHQVISWEPVYTATKHAVQAFVHATRQQIVGSGVRIGAVAPGIVLNPLWGVADDAKVDQQIAAASGIRSTDVADAVLFMLTTPRHVTIRDLVMIPTNQDI
ncbi:MAG: SDR family oxidoreductase [Actinomycetales bacterium]|nr:SDR family oxidoreductase [Actinomycetales bacterium]